MFWIFNLKSNTYPLRDYNDCLMPQTEKHRHKIAMLTLGNMNPWIEEHYIKQGKIGPKAY